jgi:hypothetical protein
LLLKGDLRFGHSGIGNDAHLSALANLPSPPDNAPCPEQIGLHVDPVKPAHVPGRIDAVQRDGAHALSREIVL